MRLTLATDDFVAREARRTKRSKGAVVEALAEEALRTRRFPGIAFRGIDWNRRPWVIGTALDVWEIVAAARGRGSIAETSARTDLTEGQVALALAYAEAYPQEIDEAIAENARSLDELRREHPAIAAILVD